MEKLIIGLSPTMTVEITGENAKEIIQKAAFWMNLPAMCPVCQSELALTYRKPQNKYDYYGVRCLGETSHAVNFGQYLEGGGLYYKASEVWTKWLSNEADGEFTSGNSNNRLPKDDELLESTAELNRLRDLIAKEWHSKPRAISYDALVRERYGVSPERLRIAQLREILEKLQAQNSTAGAGNGR